jgi:hypothetical protein
MTKSREKKKLSPRDRMLAKLKDSDLNATDAKNLGLQPFSAAPPGVEHDHNRFTWNFLGKRELCPGLPSGYRTQP